MKNIAECALCGKWTFLERHHIFFGGGRRQISDRLGLVLDICPECHRAIHEHPADWEWLKTAAQERYMEEHGLTIEDWLSVFHRSWL